MPRRSALDYTLDHTREWQTFRLRRAFQYCASRNLKVTMRRVVVLGRGGAGKSTAARRLGGLVGLPVIELDKIFWQPGLARSYWPNKDKWAAIQEELVKQPCWIMDGDLGPCDVLPVRLGAADTVLLLDFPLWLCLWRALRRGEGKWDFWWWVVTWGWLQRPNILGVLANYPSLGLHIFRSTKDLELFLADIVPSG